MLKYIDLHTHQIPASQDVFSIINLLPPFQSVPQSFFSSGIHPWQAEHCSENDWQRLEELLSDPSCLAVGECGLDFFRPVNRKIQETALARQLDWALSYHKPVIIHCVKAYNQLAFLPKKYNIPFIFHGFNSSPELAEQLVKNGSYLSFGQALLKNPQRLTKCMQKSKGRFFLESDNCGLAIEVIYEQAARLLEIDWSELLEIQKRNFVNCFGKEIW